MNTTPNKKVLYQDLGLIGYQEAWDLQEKLLQEKVAIKKQNRLEKTENPVDNHLFLLEHPHVYTIGKSGDEHNMLASSDKLNQIGATYVKTNRGGDITYHGQGQLVGYPVFDLENFYTDIHRYMRDLEEVIILTLAYFGLKGERSGGETGVWLDVGKPYARKICAMGVKASRWVTIHGFAFNVNTDMRYFDYIVPCGIKDKQVTSLRQELEMQIDMEQVKEEVKKNFELVFGCRLLG